MLTSGIGDAVPLRQIRGAIFLRQKNLGDKAFFSLPAFQLTFIVSISSSAPAALYKMFFLTYPGTAK